MKLYMTKEEINTLYDWFELVEQEIGTLNKDEVLHEKLTKILKEYEGEGFRMKLSEAEDLIKEWKECVYRIDLAETIRNDTSEDTLTKRLQEREKFLRERIEKELGVDLED